MHYIENSYETKILLTDTKDSILHSSDYHIHIKHAITAIEMMSNNPTILILLRKRQNQTSQEVQRYLFSRRNQETFIFYHECNTYLTTKVENNEAGVAWCTFI